MTDVDNSSNFALPDENVKPEAFLQEEFPQVDPAQVEAHLTEEFIKMQENMPPQDVAAHFFQMYYPAYQRLLGGLSNKDARRVAEHVVQWPLHDDNPKFNSEEAKQAFQVGVRLIDCKLIMKTFVEMERHKEIVAQKEAEALAAATPVEHSENNPIFGSTPKENKGEADGE